MISDVGKNPCSIRLMDGTVLNFFNKTIPSSGTYTYKDKNNKVKYSVRFSDQDAKNTYRACFYFRSYPNAMIEKEAHPLINLHKIDLSGSGVINADFIYEFISPSICKIADVYQLSWWCNLDTTKIDTELISSGKIPYDKTYVKKFKTNDLQSVSSESSSSCVKALCTASLSFQHLQQSFSKSNPDRITPVVRRITILGTISGQGFVTDFSTGNGSGMSIHAHTSTDDGGFAAACFMPSAIMRPLNWK